MVKWSFDDLNAPFEKYGRGSRNVISFRKAGDRCIFELYLSADNFYQVSDYFPVMNQDLLSYFGPDPDSVISEDLYMEDLEFAFEEYLENRDIEEIMEDSVIKFTIKPEGEVLSVTGGTVIGDRVVFSTPLIKFLTLNEPVYYRIEFRAE